MELKNQKPLTPSQRHLIKISTKNLKDKPTLKNQLKGKINSNGRNNSGKITVFHKGGGHKKKYRNINFKRFNECTGMTISIEYDPNRNSNIAAIYNLSEKTFFYIIAPKGLKIGDIVQSGSNVEATLGNSLPIIEIPVGSLIHNVSPKIGGPATISRAAGTFSQLKEKSLDYAKIQLSSGEQKLISSQCYASIGIVSNELSFLSKLGKAGRSRWLNIRPTVRGVAMNPIDHPHGGGEGKKSGKGKTPWGKFVKSGKTSNSTNKNINKKKSI